VNRVKHHQTDSGTCSICGVEDEDTFHALVSCSKARALRLTLRELWNIPDEDVFKCSGPDWLLILLAQLSVQQREQILFLFWRAWHLRNDLIFGKGKESVNASALFLGNYWATFTSNNDTVQMDASNKGKEKVSGVVADFTLFKDNVMWTPPPNDHIKINVDASFVESLSAASVGVVARNSAGKIIVSSWDFIDRCTSVNEAELRACLAGLYIGITLHQSIILETDCAFVHLFLANEKIDRSPLADLMNEALSISRMIQNFNISKINRIANRVAHETAKFSFDTRSDGILFNSVLPCVVYAVTNDCKNISLD
jgi:hypothetical protein